MMEQTRLLAIPAFILATACQAQALRAVPVEERYLAAQRVPVTGPVAAAFRLADNAGEHVLVLSRSAPAGGRIALLATYYDRSTAGWAAQWTIRDGVDCPGLDAAADFFAAAVAFTDLNDDGRAEVTVPYRLFCGGGVEPSTVKVILRDGPVKLAIRGESLVRLPGQQPFGGEHQHDNALLQPANAAYKRHLDHVWRLIAVDPRKQQP